MMDTYDRHAEVGNYTLWRTTHNGDPTGDLILVTPGPKATSKRSQVVNLLGHGWYAAEAPAELPQYVKRALAGLASELVLV